MGASQKLIIFDGHNLLWRCFSVPFKFYSPSGTPLHVVSTFLRFVRKSVNFLGGLSSHDCIVVVFDTQTTNANRALSKEYKANRKYDFADDEDSPFLHLPYIKQSLKTMGITALELPYFEADDVIASLTHQYKKSDDSHEVYIVSTDSDFYQLIDPQTFIVRIKPKDVFEVVDRFALQSKLGIAPEDYVFFKSLVGDHSDNIKGVPGIGPVNARKIITGEKEMDFTDHQSLLELNKQLIQLNKDVILPLPFSDLQSGPSLFTLQNEDIFQACAF